AVAPPQRSGGESHSPGLPAEGAAAIAEPPAIQRAVHRPAVAARLSTGQLHGQSCRRPEAGRLAGERPEAARGADLGAAGRVGADEAEVPRGRGQTCTRETGACPRVTSRVTSGRRRRLQWCQRIQGQGGQRRQRWAVEAAGVSDSDRREVAGRVAQELLSGGVRGVCQGGREMADYGQGRRGTCLARLPPFLPVSGQVGRHWANCGLQILDALGTLWVMGLTAQFDEATEWVEHSLNWNYEGADEAEGEEGGSSPGRKASFFEITIRALGGLASVFLRKAKELADRMLPAFSANPGFPKTEFNMKTGQGMNGWYQGTVLSEASLAAHSFEAGTVQLEFRYISQQTGNPKADRSMRAIIEAEKGRGLVPWGLNRQWTPFKRKSFGVPPMSATCHVRISQRDGPPHFTNSHITFGAMGDSYYEYLLKMYLQTVGALGLHIGQHASSMY
ncbi:unnamed protein product, partial [Polarella glacialis]